MQTFSLATARIRLEFESSDSRLFLRRFDVEGRSWLSADSLSSLFAVTVDGQRHDAHILAFHDFQIDTSEAGVQRATLAFRGSGFEVDHHIQLYDDTMLLEMWQTVRVTGQQPRQITRLDSLSLDLPPSAYELLSFSSDWGQEFEPQRVPLTDAIILETHAGRSSKGQHPWCALFDGAARVLAASVAWSGNWALRIEPVASALRLSGGIHDWQYATELSGGASIESARVVLTFGVDLNAVSQQFAQVGRRYWYPRNALSSALPVEWNHWWSYEDVDISEAVFHDNVAAAESLGVELCTLDAGWFGGAEWYKHRGDWEIVNRERFPGGIRALADDVHARGMKFGLWCEIEGLGEQAALNSAHPDFPALRDGAPRGYVCLGSLAAQQWAYDTLSRLISEYNCDWIKLDFNLDPGAGCNRTDHGHGAGDGLYAHYQGYYRLLERIRTDFPQIVLESCSSGGLRIDLGMMRQTHVTFLSDPDYPVHDLQIFWGATLMLAPSACLHWSFSEWRWGNGPAQQNFNPRDPALQPHQLDYYTRIAMLGAFGMSQKLPLLPEWVARRLAHHVDVYKRHVCRFVRSAALYRLTDQPRRSGEGERWCAFQYRLDDEHLLFVFQLPGAEPQRSIRLFDLEPDRLYTIAGFEGESFPSMSGRDLVERGLTFTALPEESSALLMLS